MTIQQKMVGYRVVNLDVDGNLVSQADSRVTLPPFGIHNKAMFIALSPKYVIDYYGHGAWSEPGEARQALVAYEFYTKDILKGNLTDIEPELSISRGRVLSVNELTDEKTACRLSRARFACHRVPLTKDT